MTVTPCCFAAAATASLVGPGIGSARSNNAGSCTWQKYCEAKISGRQTMSAPRLAASAMARLALAMFGSLSSAMDIWTRPTVTEFFAMAAKLVGRLRRD